MSPRARWIILGFALLGLAFAGASAWVHYRVLTDPTYVSPCDINAKFSCTQVYLSRYGTVRGVPVALGGVIWFALVALLAAFTKPTVVPAAAVVAAKDAKTARAPRDAGSEANAYIFALATIGLAAILYLGYASLFLLKTYCVLCMGTYVCVLGIFVTSGLSTTTGLSQLPGRLMGDLRSAIAQPVVLTIAILYVAGAASLVAFFPREGQQAAVPPAQPVPQNMEKLFSDAWAQQPRIETGVPADGAKVVVVKFNDWLCPSCKAAAMYYQPVLDKYQKESPGAVKYVIKDWPWNSDCNFNVQTIHGHEGSCAAAAAVRMARDRGKADAMIAWLFDNQMRLDELGIKGGPGAADAVKQGAQQVLGVTDFDAEYAKKLPDIRRDVADGGALGVNSTPTFYINGVHAADGNNNMLPPQYFDLALKLEIAKGASK